ncbi:Uncharacterised protein [Candidatus Tiddalikarchaeum anstoanum]|nr:Uncharacterised protein [Candidatus Tiddalikarchaeum anstoanum]
MLKEELVEKISKKFEREGRVKDVIKGDYINNYKKIGAYKAVSKTLNFKPDLIIEYENSGVDYVFILGSLVECLGVLGKIALFKEMQIDLDCKSIRFYYTDDDYLYKAEEMGLATSQETYKISDEPNKLSNLIAWYSDKIGKQIIIKRAE